MVLDKKYSHTALPKLAVGISKTGAIREKV